MLNNPEPLVQLFDEMCQYIDIACESRAEVRLAGSAAHTLHFLSSALYE